MKIIKLGQYNRHLHFQILMYVCLAVSDWSAGT
jgi:hypothetical protein